MSFLCRKRASFTMSCTHFKSLFITKVDSLDLHILVDEGTSIMPFIVKIDFKNWKCAVLQRITLWASLQEDLFLYLSYREYVFLFVSINTFKKVVDKILQPWRHSRFSCSPSLHFPSCFFCLVVSEFLLRFILHCNCYVSVRWMFVELHSPQFHSYSNPVLLVVPHGVSI